MVYEIDIYFEQPSLLLPKDSYSPDTLRLSMNKVSVKCKSRPCRKQSSSHGKTYCIEKYLKYVLSFIS